MSETEFENDSNVAVAEPPAEKPEKPVRKTTRKPKADKVAAPPVAEEEVPITADEPELIAPPIVDVANDAPPSTCLL